MATPRTLSKRRRETLTTELPHRSSSARNASKRRAICEATPQGNVAKDLCTAMSVTSLASASSDTTGIIKRLPPSRLAPSTRDTPDFHATTSPRLESRLARRPQPQFPYLLQPFQLLPASPEDRSQASVEEANRRIQQARALSDRQLQFGQLLDLASGGYIPAHQCGAQEDQQEEGEEDTQVNDASPAQSSRPHANSPGPDLGDQRRTSIPRSRSQSESPKMSSQGPSYTFAANVAARRLTRLEPAGRLLTSKIGQGSIRVLRMSQ